MQRGEGETESSKSRALLVKVQVCWSLQWSHFFIPLVFGRH